MIRLRLFLLLALVAVALPATAASAIVDKGRDKPPKYLPNYHKAVWMSEWVACWRPLTMKALARELRLSYAKITTPQQGARLLSERAMRFLYEDPLEKQAALDGCRNGILWRFYHES
jgi:hypothetical protein